VIVNDIRLFTTFVFGSEKLKLASYPMPPDTELSGSFSRCFFLMTARAEQSYARATWPHPCLFRISPAAVCPGLLVLSDECHVIPCNGTFNRREPRRILLPA